MLHSSFSAFLSHTAISGRIKRGVSYVVIIETPKGWSEIDADDANHAARLAEHWVSVMNAHSASVQKVKADGSLKNVKTFSRDYSDIEA